LDYLNVFIGLIVFYSILSMIASTLLEFIFSIMRRRGKVLRNVILQICCGNRTICKEFYSLPQVTMLFQGGLSEKQLEEEFPTDGDEEADTSPTTRKGSLVSGVREFCNPDKIQWPSYISPETFARAMTEGIVEKSLEQIDHLEESMVDAAARWESKYPDEDFQSFTSFIKELVQRSGNTVEQFQLLLMQHFQEVNERATGWYQKTTAKYLFCIGLFLAVATNSDSVMMLRRLLSDPGLRKAMVEQAEGMVETAPVPVDGEAPTTNDERTAINPSVIKDMERISSYTGGWSEAMIKVGPSVWALRPLGWLLTAFAISLGSKFWFDLLKKVMSMRSALAPGKSAQGEEEDERFSGTDRNLTPNLPLVGPPYQPPRKPTREEVTRSLMGATFSKLAYLEKAKAENEKYDGFEFVTGMESGKDSPFDTQLYLFRKGNELVVAFRGSEKNLGDWATNARFRKTSLMTSKGPYEPESIEVHRGFHGAFDSIWDELKKALSAEAVKGAEVVSFCGHSLGGAQAVLAATRFLLEKELLASVVPESKDFRGLSFDWLHTIGQPRVGNQAFADLVMELCAGRYYRAVNRSDVVARVPLMSMDFAHSGILHYFSSEGHLMIQPSFASRILDLTLDEAMPKLEERMRNLVADHKDDFYISGYRHVRDRLSEATT